MAVLAGVGVSWYTWLEQGRDITVSSSVLDAISRALRLDESERTHLYVLAGLNPPIPACAPAMPLPPRLQHMLDGWRPCPACMFDRHWNWVWRNEASNITFGYTDSDRNFLLTFFTDHHFRSRVTTWAALAPAVVAQFRADAARYPGDPEFQHLTDHLRNASPEFTGLWENYDVREKTEQNMEVVHPEAGDLAFEINLLLLPDWPGHRLYLEIPKPDTDTWRKLRDLLQRG